MSAVTRFGLGGASSAYLGFTSKYVEVYGYTPIPAGLGAFSSGNAGLDAFSTGDAGLTTFSSGDAGLDAFSTGTAGLDDVL